MKKSIFLFIALCINFIAQAQNRSIDEMFKKYSERDGFTVVTISSRMLSIFAGNGSEATGAEDIMRSLKSIRILSVEDSLLNKSLNFYTELTRKLDLSVYEELLMVKEGRDITKILIRQNGERISELLLITGGPDGNSLIFIEGDLNLKNISDLSKNIDSKEIRKLDKINQK
jgi:hypothetical protein